VPLLTSTEKSAQRRRLPTKTPVQQRESAIRRFPLFLCLVICLHSALSETNFGRSVIYVASLRYFRLATNISAEKFSCSDTPLYFRSFIVYKKIKFLLFYKSKLLRNVMLRLRIIHYYYWTPAPLSRSPALSLSRSVPSSPP